MNYLNEHEQVTMLEKFREFDRNFMQQSFEKIIKELETEKK